MKFGLVIQGPLLSIGRGVGSYKKKSETKEEEILHHECDNTIINNINNYGELFDQIVISTWEEETVSDNLQSFIAENSKTQIFKFHKKGILKLPKLNVPSSWSNKTSSIMSVNNNLNQYTGCRLGVEKLNKCDFVIRIRTDQEINLAALKIFVQHNDSRITIPGIFFENNLYQIADFYFGGSYAKIIDFFSACSKNIYDFSPHINPISSLANAFCLDDLEMKAEILHYAKDSFQYKIMQNHVVNNHLRPAPAEIYQTISWRGEKAGAEWRKQNNNLYFSENFDSIKNLKLSKDSKQIDSKLFNPKSHFFTKVMRRLFKINLFK